MIDFGQLLCNSVEIHWYEREFLLWWSVLVGNLFNLIINVGSLRSGTLSWYEIAFSTELNAKFSHLKYVTVEKCVETYRFSFVRI